MSLLYLEIKKAKRKSTIFKGLKFYIAPSSINDGLFDVFKGEEVKQIGGYAEKYLMVLTDKHLYKITSDLIIETLKYPAKKIKSITFTSDDCFCIVFIHKIICWNKGIKLNIKLSNIRAISCYENVIYAGKSGLSDEDDEISIIYRIDINGNSYTQRIFRYDIGKIEQIVSIKKKRDILTIQELPMMIQ